VSEDEPPPLANYEKDGLFSPLSVPMATAYKFKRMTLAAIA
jgi:hypothetical protein